MITVSVQDRQFMEMCGELYSVGPPIYGNWVNSAITWKENNSLADNFRSVSLHPMI